MITVLMVTFGFVMMLAACSNKNEDQSAEYDISTESQQDSVQDGGFAVEREETENVEQAQDDADSGESSEVPENTEAGQQDRKIIYTADMRVEVRDYQESLGTFQDSISDYGGYMVESAMYEETENGTASGYVTARIPQEHFNAFIEVVEDGSDRVLESNVSGQDVTEEYVDLESRLASKEVVEERLLSFMEQAEETEDLLAISDDLANVQEEIEEITGRMNYLQDKTDLATVTIHIEEKDVRISGVGEEDLNTWEKTQEQFMKSINFLISAFSGLFVFLVGNLPLILLLGVIGLIVFWVIRKQMNRKA
ncbi:DUF4349 domain-containing protein [Virgibacillus sp. YIM 98842]|uniref:DUF4349 domain-containing protein n=1 Tax=Virgibacillus sp. YIM 98842 TaxID=2663533 RepID=UPI001F08B8FD|nr:DUF4349 domain-containing protein [Virgibacillus sp. YIM 98842]